MAIAANFHFFLARNNSAFAGIKASDVADPYLMRKGVVPSLIVGPQMRAKSDRPAKWARIIPPGMSDLPQYAVDRDKNEKIMRGSIVSDGEGDQKKTYLVSHRDENAYYVLVRTGLMARNGNTVEDRMSIQKTAELVTHGSYSFDNGSLCIARAQNESTLSAQADPSIKIGTVAAERVGAKAMGKKIPLLGCPESSYVLWRMPVGAMLLIRDVNGKLTRLVAEKSQLRVVDAVKYGGFFDQLEDAHHKAHPKKSAVA